MENKLLASAVGEKLSKVTFVILMFCGALLAAIGAAFVIFEFIEAAQGINITTQYLLEGILYAALGLLILIFAVPFRKRGNTSLEIYEDHVMGKWLLAKQAVRIEFGQIVDVKVKGRGRIDLTLGPPFSMSAFSTIVIFRLDNKDAQNLYEILRERRGAVLG